MVKQVRERYPNVPIVFYSRKATAEDMIQCMKEDGVFDVILKLTPQNNEDEETATLESKHNIVLRFNAAIDMSRKGLLLESLRKIRKSA